MNEIRTKDSTAVQTATAGTCARTAPDGSSLRTRPTCPSGGQISRIELADFLSRGYGPEQQSLLQLIGTLLDPAPGQVVGGEGDPGLSLAGGGGHASIAVSLPRVAASGAQKALNEQSGGRFLLGLGVSHSPLVEGFRGQHYGKPVETMRAYLEGMKKAHYTAPPPPETPKTVIAALGPKMLALAAEQADGAHPYNVTPEHTAQARKTLGLGKLLCPEQMILAESDPAKARAKARASLKIYLSLPNYFNNWKRLGFTDADFADGGSDRLIDAIVAWGDDEAIRRRLQAHWDAGADQVCIQALGGLGTPIPKPDEELLKRFAPGASAS